MEKPLVSICIPTFNGATYIAEAMDSAIAQTYPNLEIIVSDDASTDDTLKVIESYITKTNIPIYIYHHKPSGIGANWNHCIKQANGDYIKFLFQDDVLEPRCVEEMVKVMERNTGLGMVACKRLIIFEKDYSPDVVADWLNRCEDLQRNLNLPIVNGISILDHSLFKHKQFLRSPLNKIGEPTAILFRRELVDKIGYFRNDLSQILDYEFCYRILKNYKIAVIHKTLVKFRLHEKQATNLNMDVDTGDDEKYMKILYKDYLNYVDDYTKKHLLKKYHPIYRLVFGIKARINKYFRY